MARIDWLTACELAFWDRQDRLCLVGITTRLPVPDLPIAVNELMLVAHLTDLSQIEEFEVHVDVVMPNGTFTSPRDNRCIVIEVSGEYVMVTLRGLPLADEGVYRFEVSLGGQPPATLNIPVLMVGTRTSHAGVH